MAKSSSKKSFLDYFKFNDSDEFEDDLFDEDDDDEDDDDFDTKPEKTKPTYAASSTSQSGQAAQKKQKPVKPVKSNSTYSSGGNSKLVPISSSRSQYGSQDVFVIKPFQLDDAQTIIDHLTNGQAIVINMEGMDVAFGQRIIDFVSGACYAIDGSLQGITGNIFIATPSEINVSGDLREELIGDMYLSPQLGQF